MYQQKKTEFNCVELRDWLDKRIQMIERCQKMLQKAELWNVVEWTSSQNELSHLRSECHVTTRYQALWPLLVFPSLGAWQGEPEVTPGNLESTISETKVHLEGALRNGHSNINVSLPNK